MSIMILGSKREFDSSKTSITQREHLRVSSRGGVNYMLMIIDDFSRKILVE